MSIDVNFNFKKHPLTGDLVVHKDRSAAIRQTLTNIVRSNYYDRGFNVEFGTNTDALLFENVDNITAQQLKNIITTSINNFEPRVSVNDVAVSLFEHTIQVNIVYQELNLPDVKNLVIDLTVVR